MIYAPLSSAFWISASVGSAYIYENTSAIWQSGGGAGSKTNSVLKCVTRLPT